MVLITDTPAQKVVSYTSKWFKFFRFKSKPKTTLQTIMQMRKPNFV